MLRETAGQKILNFFNIKRKKEKKFFVSLQNKDASHFIRRQRTTLTKIQKSKLNNSIK
jgi:hypothetical protein